jgi:hypothetical protein
MALVPDSIGMTLGTLGSGIDRFITNVRETVETVRTVGDQLMGKSEGLPVPTQAPSAPVSAVQTVPAIPWKVIGIGVVVVIGLALVLRK